MTDAKIAKQLAMYAVTIDGPFSADLIESWRQSFGGIRGMDGPLRVCLTNAEIGGNISLIGTSFDGALQAPLMQVGGHLAYEFRLARTRLASRTSI